MISRASMNFGRRFTTVSNRLEWPRQPATPPGSPVTLDGTGRLLYNKGIVELSTSAYTLFLLWRPLGADGVSQSLLSGETAAGKTHWAMYRLGSGFWTTNSIGVYRYWLPPSDNEDMVWTTSLTATLSDGLIATFVGAPLAGGAGNELYVSQYKRSGGAWVHDTGSPARTNFQLAHGDTLGAGGKLAIGAVNGTDRMNGTVYAAAVWHSLRTNHDALMASASTSALLATGPAWAVDAKASMATDLTGNGGNLVSAAGNTPAAALDPGIWTLGA